MIPKAVNRPRPDRKALADNGAKKRQDRTAIRSESPGSGETTRENTFKRIAIANTAQASFSSSEYPNVPALLRNAMENPSTIPLMVSIVSFDCCAYAKFIRFSWFMPLPSANHYANQSYRTLWLRSNSA